MRAHMAECEDPDCRRVACTGPQSPTNLERTLYTLLTEFPTVEREWRPPGGCCRYRLDAYLPEYALNFEADGARWHRDKPGQPERDAKRDAHLLATHAIVTVRLGETELLQRAYGHST